MCIDPFSSVGVVPIFVNAGASLAPMIVAPLASFFVILFKPSALIALIRRKPWVPLPVFAAIALIWFLIAGFGSAPAQAASEKISRHTTNTTDWTAFALKLIEQERNAAKTTGIKPTWQYAADGGMVLSSPAIADGKVYGTASIQELASFFGTIYCLDARTGRELWKQEKADGEDLKAFFSSPALSEDRKSIIVGQGLHADADCSLLCFNTEDGKLRWKVKTSLHIESSPAIQGDLVVVGAGAIEDNNHKPTTDPGYVFAVQISTGKELWRHKVADPESSPAIDDDGTIYIGSGFNGNAIVALRSQPDDVLKQKNQSRELWKTPAKYPITGPVTLVDDLVIVGGGNGDFVYEDPKPAGVVMAIDRKTGTVKWEAKTDAAVLGRIVARDGKLYCPVRTGQVITLSLADGQPIWKQSVSGKSPILAGIALSADGKTVFAVAKDGYLALLDSANGQLIEKHSLNDPKKPPEKGLTLSTPTLADGKLYVGSETGGLRAFEPAAPKP